MFSDVLDHISRSKLKSKPAPAPEKKLPVGSQRRRQRQQYEDIPLKDVVPARSFAGTEAHYSLTSEIVIDELLE
jgi:hypothetical protein